MTYLPLNPNSYTLDPYSDGKPNFFNYSWETNPTVTTEQPVNRATSSPHSLSQQQLMSHTSLCSSQGQKLPTATQQDTTHAN